MVYPGDLRPVTPPDNQDALGRIARLLQLRHEIPRRSGAGIAPTAEGAVDKTLDLAHDEIAALLEIIPASIALVRDGVLLYANGSFVQLFDYASVEQLETARSLSAVLSAPADAPAPYVSAIETRSKAGRLRKVPIAFRRIQTGTGRLDILIAREDGRRRADFGNAGEDSGKVLSFPRRKSESLGPSAELAPPPLDFLAKVSHEVRTPLNSIIGFAELMREERMGAIENPKYRGYIDDIHASGLYALSLINDLLDISKVQAGRFELDFTPVDVADVVEESVRIMHPQASRSRIALRTSVTADLPRVLADRRRLKQILLNLLSNAIKFTPPGGQAVLSVGRTAARGVRIRLRDSGIGMTAHQLSIALQPFRQLHTSPASPSGTGLGLPLTKALAEASQATFTISSEPKVGTIADLYFAPDRILSSKEMI